MKPAAEGSSVGVVIVIDEDDNVVAPGNFLPAAERYNLISQLDHWVVKTAPRRRST